MGDFIDRQTQPGRDPGTGIYIDGVWASFWEGVSTTKYKRRYEQPGVIPRRGIRPRMSQRVPQSLSLLVHLGLVIRYGLPGFQSTIPAPVQVHI